MCNGGAERPARCALDIDYACLKRDIRVADVAQTLLQLLDRHSSPVS